MNHGLRYIVAMCALLVSASVFAWLDGDSFYPRLAHEDWLTAKDKEVLLDDMSHTSDILVIDGVEYMMPYSPLELIRGRRRYQEMYDGLIASMEGLNFSAFWGDKANRRHNSWDCRLEVRGDSLCLTEIKSCEYVGEERVFDPETREFKVIYEKGTPQDMIDVRMEEFTDCRFVGGRMFLPIVSGTVFAKKRNPIPCPEGWSTANKSPEDMRVYLRWVKEPVYRIVFDEGCMVSMEEMTEPVTAEEQRAFVWRTVLISLAAVLLVAVAFMLRDSRRKRHYLRMFEALQKNQAQLVTAVGQPDDLLEEESGEAERKSLSREEVIALYRDNFALSCEQFRTGEWPQRLEKMSATLHADMLMLSVDERKALSMALDECFVQVNVNLRSEARLTNDDVRCCLLSMLGCPLPVVAVCLGSSTEAVQTRKSRLKDKLPRDVFEMVFSKN